MNKRNKPEHTQDRPADQKKLSGKDKPDSLPVVHTESMPAVWKKTRWPDRMKLRIAYPIGLMTTSITKDLLKHKWLNLAFVAVSLIPGPSGVLFLPALLLSYTFRWDKNGKETRKRFGSFFRNGVPLSRYRDIIKPDPAKPGRYYVDTKALAKQKFNIIKQSTIRVNKAAAENVPRLYKKYISAPFDRAANWSKGPLGRVIGKERAENAITTIFNGKAKVERSLKTATDWTVAKGKALSDWSGKRLTDGFNAAAQCQGRLSSCLHSGWKHGKQKAKKLVDRSPRP